MLNVSFPEIAETGTTFEENALIKAKNGCKNTGLPTVADDSGLCVDALGGAPGVYSSRYSGEDGNDEKNNQKLLFELKNIPKEKRTARFVSVIACVFPDGRSFTVRGECEGTIAFEKHGEKGFGYDPLFLTEKGCFGEITDSEKDSISHRGKSLGLFSKEIKKYV